MIPRSELTHLLRSRFPDLPQDQAEQLAGEILALENEWEEVAVPHRDLGYSHSNLCSSICWLASQTDQGSVIRFFRRKK